jgi:hypothetical protein
MADAFDMLLVHEVFRNELHDIPALIRGVPPREVKRSTVVGDHVTFILAALHHHHMAEDELLWWKLRERVPASAEVIGRMEDAHAVIADGVEQVQAQLRPWVATADHQSAERLAACVEDLSRHVDDHLGDEERHVVPLIDEHITDDEWRAATARGAAFMSRRNVKLALVLGGMVLDACSVEDRQRFLTGVPLPQRLLVRLLADRTCAKYRTELYA